MTLLSDPRDTDAGRRGARRARTATLTDGELIAAVRAGDADAYSTLYELHAGSVRRLAARLCRDGHEADDVVSEVFANTLRAIQRGGGPRDEFGLYALRSVRNTVTKLRTRTDTARAVPTDLADLDRAAPDEPYHLASDVEQAFGELPTRFQDVLWTTAVEGHTPAEVAGSDRLAGTLDPGAVASLSQRARKALGRSYLRVHTHRPARHPECKRVRGYLPGYIQHTTGAATAQRIEIHLARCIECSQVRDEMCELNGRLRTMPWLALLAAAVRRVGLSVATASAPVAATAAAPIVAIAVAATMVARYEAPERPSSPAEVIYQGDVLPSAPAVASPPDGSGGDADLAPDPEPAPGGSGTASVGPAVNGVVDPPPSLSGPEGTPPGVGDPIVDPAPVAGPPEPGDGDTGTDVQVSPTTPPGVVGGVDPGAVPVGGVVGGAVDGVSDTVVPAVGDGVDTLLDDVDGTVDGVVDVVGALPGGLPGVIDETGQLVGDVGDTIGNTLDTAENVTGAVTDTVETTVTTVVATVEQGVDDVVDVVEVDPNAPVTDLVDDLVGGDGVVPNVVDNLVGTPPTTAAPTPPAACAVNLLGICL